MGKHKSFFNWVGILLLALVFVAVLSSKLAWAGIITGPGGNGGSGGGPYSTGNGGNGSGGYGWVRYGSSSVPGYVTDQNGNTAGGGCAAAGYPWVYALVVPNSDQSHYKAFAKNTFGQDPNGDLTTNNNNNLKTKGGLAGGTAVHGSEVKNSYDNNGGNNYAAANFGWMCGGSPNSPPTGVISVSCNANGTGKAHFIFSDPDGATTGTVTVTAGSPNYSITKSNGDHTITIPAANASSGSWTAVLVVQDKGGNSDKTYSDTSATCNKNPVGNINTTPTGSATPSCQAVKLVVVNDPNTPASNITYYLSVNGGAKQSGVAQQGNLPFDVTVSGYPGFNVWATNKVDLYAKDIQTGVIVGVLDTLTLPICGTVSCGTSTLGATATAGVAQNFTVNMNYSTPIAAGPPPGAKFNINITGPSNTSYVGVGSASASSPVVSNPVSFPASSGGSYNISWTYYGTTCNQGFPTQVGYSPYFNVLGGDIAAGPGFGATCSTGVNSTISGTNIDTSGSGPFFGAGTDRAAFASGDITSFATSQTPLGADASSAGLIPKGLSFANSQAGGTKYGNDFKRSNWCMPDYTAVKKVTSGGVDFTTPGTRTYKVSGPYIMGSGLVPLLGNTTTIGKGVHVTVIVNGDAYLTGDIKYAAYNGLGDAVSDIPQLRLIVTGNIYIVNTVQELHGFYAAQGGDIHTCTSLINNTSSALTGLTTIPRDTTYYDSCNHQLTIYGGVAAGKLDLERTWGNLIAVAGTPAQPAEQFIFTPELWLGNLQGPNDTTEPVQAFTSLPPNL